MSVLEVLREVCLHPRRHVLERWNWKAAILSACLRGTLFFTTNLSLGLAAAEQALVVDVLFRVPLVGTYAAVVQALAVAQPAWAATAMVMVLVPALAHTLEFLIHRAAGTPALHASVMASVALSALSSSFESYAMRRGALVVGPGAATIGRDLSRLPGLIGAFILAAPAAVSRWCAAGMRPRGQV